MTQPHPTLPRFARLAAIGAALALVPLASPLLVSLGLILTGVLVAQSCAAGVLSGGSRPAGGAAGDPVIFRHVL